MKQIQIGNTVIEFGDGWSNEDLLLFKKFYQDNPHKLQEFEKQTAFKNSEQTQTSKKNILKSKKDRHYSITQVEAFSVSYKNIHGSIKDKTLKEGTHYKKDKNSGKLLFKQKGLDKLLDLFVITDKEYKEFEKAYNFLRWEKDLSENKIAIALSKESKDFTYTAVKNFIYGYNPNKTSYRKKVFLKYLSAINKAAQRFM